MAFGDYEVSPSGRPRITVTPDDRDIIARTALGESDDPDQQAQIVRDLVASGDSPSDAALSRGRYKVWDNPRNAFKIDAKSPDYVRVAQLADSTVAGNDIDELLRGYGVKKPKIDAPYIAATPEPTNNPEGDIKNILKGYGVNLGGSPVKKETPPPAATEQQIPGQVNKEAEELSRSRGFVQPIVEGMPLVGPALEAGGAALAAGIQPMVGGADESTFGERFTRNMNLTQEANRLFAQRNPVTALAGNVLGGAAVYGPGALTVPGRMAMGLPTAWTPTAGGQFYSGVAGGAIGNALDAAARGQDPYTGLVLGGATGGAAPIITAGARGITNALGNNLIRAPGELGNLNTTARQWLVNAERGGATDQIGPAGFFGERNPELTRLMQGINFANESGADILRGAYGQRGREAFGRVESYLHNAFGPPTNVVEYERFLTEARKAAADPLYEAWRSTQVHPTNELKSLIPRLEKAGAFDKAEELSGISGEPINRSFFTGGPQKDFPTTQSWDYVKRGLDSQIETAYRGGDNTKARELVRLKGELIGEIEKTPAGLVWRQARQEFADRSSMIDQLAAGRDTFVGGRSGLSVDEMREELRHLSTPELAARVQGARSAVTEAMGDSIRGSTTMRDKLLAPNNQEKLRMLLGDRHADELIRNLDAERVIMGKRDRVIGGSQTTSNTEAVNALKPSAMPQYNPKPLEPLTWIPPHILEQLRPSAIIQGAREHAHANARNALAPLLVRPAEGSSALNVAIAAESLRRLRAERFGTAAGTGLNALAAQPGMETLRLRGYEPPRPRLLRSAQ